MSPSLRAARPALLALLLAFVACDRAGSPSSAGTPPARDPELVRVTLLPDENAAKIIQDNQGFKRYLEERLGKKVEIHVFPNYTAMIEAFRAGNIDLCYFGPLSYCIAIDKGAPAECFACKVKGGLKTYRSVIITHVDSGIGKLTDIKGRTMAFGDVASTSSHLIPKCELAKAGIPEHDYKESFLGKHDVVAVNVLSRGVDAGGLSKPIFQGLLESGKIDRTKIRVLHESPEIPDYPWAMQRDLAPPLKEKIRKAFYELKDPEILKPLKADGFAEIKDEDYTVIRDAARILNKNLASLEK
ncbi:MAG TPA: phosphate/phosphite/phosphonate ABC transporter substrate-binding protein [Planctomycetota bacterium]|nr:phosphate/phosphite/phosphonate ABC transporter substrate-binding protein [Planctomycetota bacterium]